MISYLAKFPRLVPFALLTWMSLILFVSSRSYLPGDGTVEGWIGQYKDEVGHLVEYAVLGLLTHAYLRSHTTERQAIFSSLILCVVFSLGDELFQSFIPNRTAETKDIFLDAVGTVVGLSLKAVLVPRLKTYRRKDTTTIDTTSPHRSSDKRNDLD